MADKYLDDFTAQLRMVQLVEKFGLKPHEAGIIYNNQSTEGKIGVEFRFTGLDYAADQDPAKLKAYEALKQHVGCFTNVEDGVKEPTIAFDNTGMLVDELDKAIATAPALGGWVKGEKK